MKLHFLLLIFILFAIISCGGVSKRKLTEEGKRLRILSSKRGHRCNVVDKVVGQNEIGSEELAKNHARNLAAKAGGDAIHFDEVVRNGKEIKVYSTAYRCR